MEIKIPKEVRQHSETIFFGLSTRQFIWTPVLILVNFVNVDFRDAVGVKVFNQFFKRMVPEPKMIQSDVKRIVDVLIFLQYPLEKKRGFSNSSGSFYPDNSGIPVDSVEKVSFKIQIHLFYFPVIIVHQRLYVRTLHDLN